MEAEVMKLALWIGWLWMLVMVRFESADVVLFIPLLPLYFLSLNEAQVNH